MKDKIYVTKAFVPPINEYMLHLQEIFQSGQLTNLGLKHQELETKLKSFLSVDNLLCVTNGTIALQLIYKLFEKGEIITTPFSYVATSNSIIWEGFTPRYADINPENCCLDPIKAEALINNNTRAIVLTHVYGIPCDVEAFEALGKKYSIPIVYDAAHAFGVKYKGESILNYGDFSTLSFHATKLFHTVEGGAIITKKTSDLEKLSLYRSFGHIGDDYYDIGINGKMSELHSAMGLTVLPYVNNLIEKRKDITEIYDKLLIKERIFRPVPKKEVDYNYSYFPIIFESQELREKIHASLSKNDIYSRRYFSPSLNRLPFHIGESCPIAESYAERVLCLPLYPELKEETVMLICKIINSSLS